MNEFDITILKACNEELKKTLGPMSSTQADKKVERVTFILEALIQKHDQAE